LFWATEKLHPAQEHFLSCLVRKKILSAIDEIPSLTNSSSRWLLFLHEQEDHEIPLLLAQYLLKESGAEVIYLGARVPFENSLQAAATVKPTHVVTFFSTRHRREFMINYLRQLNLKIKTSQIFVGGNPENFFKQPIPEKITVIESVEDFIGKISVQKKKSKKNVT